MRTKINILLWGVSFSWWIFTAMELMNHAEYRDISMTLWGAALSVGMVVFNFKAWTHVEKKKRDNDTVNMLDSFLEDTERDSFDPMDDIKHKAQRNSIKTDIKFESTER